MKKKHIQLLLVEDDPTDREAVKRFVAEENLPYELHTAESKKVFSEKIRERSYDMILLDYNLPDAKGVELLREIKDIPVIIVTGSGNENTVLEAMHLGAADYLVKDLECNYLKLLPAAIGNVFKRQEAEIALKESEARYRSLLEGTRLIAWEFDPASDCFTFVSGKAKEITGIPSEQWLEKGFRVSHVHPADREIATKNFTTAAEKCEDHEFEYRFLTQDGGFIWVRNIVHVVTENAKATKLRGALIDISEQKKMEESLWESKEKYRMLMDNINMGVTYIDTNYRVVTANSFHANLMDRSVREYIGKECFREFEQREEICTHCPGTKAMLSGKPEEVNTEGVLPDGSKVSVHIKAFPITDTDGKHKGFVEVVEDITERKRMAEEMQENMDRLKKFHNLAVDRELRMVELKQEVNELLEAAGKEKRYVIHQPE